MKIRSTLLSMMIRLFVIFNIIKHLNVTFYIDLQVNDLSSTGIHQLIGLA